MKKLLLGLLVLCAMSVAASAQTTEVKKTEKKAVVETPASKTKVKKTTTPTEKVHNVVDPKHKKYSGTKTKHKAKKES